MKLHPPVEPDFYLPAVSLEDALACVNFIDPDAAQSMWNVDHTTGHVSCRYLLQAWPEASDCGSLTLPNS
jgi:hypothetical protein